MTTKLATKGQVVIPKAIRDRFDLEAGDDFEIWADGSGEIILRPLAKGDNAGLIKHLCSAPADLEIPERSREHPKPVEL